MKPEQSLDAKLLSRLDARAHDGTLRQLKLVEGLIDFASNDYLGFARNKLLSPLSDHLSGGSGGSRLISGDSSLARETEELIAQFHRAEAALIFGSGYTANVGLFSCLAGKDDHWISDELVHASIIDGIKMSKAEKHIFRHNDLQQLEDLLKGREGKAFVATESLFSMNGDPAPLEEMADLCAKYNAFLVVDEAHAAGVLGPEGRGLVCAAGLENKVSARIFTYGKAFGSYGAAIAGSSVLINYLINFARSFVYSTAPPPLLFQLIREGYQIMPSANRQALFDLGDYFQKTAEPRGLQFFLPARHHIRAVAVGNPDKAKALSDQLWKEGIYAKAILSPTVPAGTERIRICLHTYNSPEQIDRLIQILERHI